MHTWVFMFTFMCVHVSMHEHGRVTKLHVHVSMFIHVLACVHKCGCVHMRVYVHTHVPMYMLSHLFACQFLPLGFEPRSGSSLYPQPCLVGTQ